VIAVIGDPVFIVNVGKFESMFAEGHIAFTFVEVTDPFVRVSGRMVSRNPVWLS